jgi:hypothetical protein
VPAAPSRHVRATMCLRCTSPVPGLGRQSSVWGSVPAPKLCSLIRLTDSLERGASPLTETCISSGCAYSTLPTWGSGRKSGRCCQHSGRAHGGPSLRCPAPARCAADSLRAPGGLRAPPFWGYLLQYQGSAIQVPDWHSHSYTLMWLDCTRSWNINASGRVSVLTPGSSWSFLLERSCLRLKRQSLQIRSAGSAGAGGVPRDSARTLQRNDAEGAAAGGELRLILPIKEPVRELATELLEGCKAGEILPVAVELQEGAASLSQGEGETPGGRGKAGEHLPSRVPERQGEATDVGRGMAGELLPESSPPRATVTASAKAASRSSMSCEFCLLARTSAASRSCSSACCCTRAARRLAARDSAATRCASAAIRFADRSVKKRSPAQPSLASAGAVVAALGKAWIV